MTACEHNQTSGMPVILRSHWLSPGKMRRSCDGNLWLFTEGIQNGMLAGSPWPLPGLPSC